VTEPATTEGPPTGDPRLAFVYQEALRGLIQQQGVMDSLLNRAGTLIFAASFANSLLGITALADGVGLWDWVALACLLAVGTSVVVVMWPYYRLWFRFDPQDLLEAYVDAEQPASMDAMHRALALRIRDDMRRNWRVLRRMREACQVGLVLLLVNIVAWLASIAGSAG
jgi:hypothetical protein